jgi:multicomponent Na+:H+ antiporter subunit G
VIEAVRTSAIVGLVLAGLFFTFVSTAGVLRLPDVYSRAHTASQADTLGAGFTLAGVALALGWSTTTVKAVLLLFFIFLTNPTAAHAISRAAHEEGVEPWTTDDERTDEELYQASRSRPVADGGPPADSQTEDGTESVDSPAEDGTASAASQTEDGTESAASSAPTDGEGSGQTGGDER